MGCERIHGSINTEEKKKKCFYSLSKGGKGANAHSGVGPDAWVFESFIEFKEQSVGKNR